MAVRKELTFHRALEVLGRFPVGIPGWHDLDPATQANTTGNVIEAYAAIGLGAADPRLVFLMGTMRWDLGDAVRDWYEPTLFRIRAGNALGLNHSGHELQRVRGRLPTFDRLFPFLVSLDAVLDQSAIAKSPPSMHEIDGLSKKLCDLHRGEASSLRAEDRLYLNMLAMTLPLVRFPVDGRAELDKAPRLAVAAIRSTAPGRYRRLGFICECLGRCEDRFRTTMLRVFDKFRDEAENGRLTPTEETISDFRSPSSLKQVPELVAVYNAALFVRVAKYALADEARERLCAWARAITSPGSEALDGLSGRQGDSGQSNEETAPEDARVFVEWWLDGRPLKQGWTPYSDVYEDARLGRVDLVVDEKAGQLRFHRGSKSGKDESLRKITESYPLIGLWHMLNRSDGDILPRHIQDTLRSGTEASDHAVRQVMVMGRTLLGTVSEDDLGWDWLPTRIHGAYWVRGDRQSWCWIRKESDRSKSVLLRHSYRS